MKWLLALCTALFIAATAKEGCLLDEFYMIAWTVHNPSERHQMMLKWLDTNARFCSVEDYATIWNNIAEWAGTADTPQLRYQITQGFNAALERSKK
jgi:hypothetical protein